MQRILRKIKGFWRSCKNTIKYLAKILYYTIKYPNSAHILFDYARIPKQIFVFSTDRCQLWITNTVIIKQENCFGPLARGKNKIVHPLVGEKIFIIWNGFLEDFSPLLKCQYPAEKNWSLRCTQSCEHTLSITRTHPHMHLHTHHHTLTHSPSDTLTLSHTFSLSL